MSDRVLLLDAMDTLVVDPFWTTFPAFFGMELRELLQHKRPGAWLEFERGEIDEATYAQTAFTDGRAYDHDGLRAAVVEAYRYIDGMEALLARLKAHDVEMHVLSNYPCWYRHLDDKLQISRFAPFTFVSCDTGVRKPDPESYLGPARTLGRNVGELIFVDDREKNTAAARAVGLDAITFTDTPALSAALVERGVLPG